MTGESEMKRNATKDRALSTVFGAAFFLILIVSLASILFLALYRYNDSVNQGTAIEDMRSQEKIIMIDLSLSNDFIMGITVENLGSITSQIRGFYVDSQFI